MSLGEYKPELPGKGRTVGIVLLVAAVLIIAGGTGILSKPMQWVNTGWTKVRGMGSAATPTS